MPRIGRIEYSSLVHQPVPECRQTNASAPSENQLNPARTAQRSLASRFLSHPATASLFLCLVAWALLLIGIHKPKTMYYDEGYFVPEARAFLQGVPNHNPFVPSLARPPLGKLIMAIGMKVAGDNPLGWRIAGATCGALTVAAIYLWTYLLVSDSGLALLAAGLTLCNNFLFVMSRIGMMDAFLVFFLIWSLVAYTASFALEISAGGRRALFICAGILVGLGAACKWNAVDTLAVFFAVSAALLVAAYYLPLDSRSSFSSLARHAREVGVPALLLGLIVAPIASYSLTYWPVCRLLHRPFGIHEFVSMNVFIWRFSTTEVSNPLITSPWYTWPLNLRPQRALSYLIANPIVSWGGLVALAVCLRRFCRRMELPEGLVLLLFASNFLQWVATPQKGLFYYYYYPSVMILGVAIAVSLRSLPRAIYGVRIGPLLFGFASLFFLRCYPQMAHLQAPWDCMFGCWI